MITLVLVVVSILLGYKIYNKGLKDGISLKINDTLSPEPLIDVPDLPKPKSKDQKIEDLELEMMSMVGGDNDEKLEQLRKERDKLMGGIE